MLKLMIVDDDALMCNQIAALVDWEQLGIEIACYALSGQEAMEVLEKKPIDFILTDINMPGITGVELIEHINRNYPDIHVIALSGYDDFHFVRNSLKYGAYDYVLKSKLTKEGLETLIREIIKKKKMKEDMELHKNLTVEQMTESFFKRLILRKDFDQEQVENIIKNLKIPFNKDCTVVMLVYKNQEVEDEVLNRSLYHMCQQILKEAEFTQMVDLDPAYYCVVVSFKREVSQASCLKKLEAWGNAIGDSGKRFFNVSLGVSISDICQEIFWLQRYYKQAQQNADLFFYDDSKNLACAWRMYAQAFTGRRNPAFPEIRDMRVLIREGNYEAVKKGLEEFFSKVRKQQGSISEFRSAAAQWVNKLADGAEEEGISREYLFEGKLYTYEDCYKIPSLTQWQQFLERLLKRLFQAVWPAEGLKSCHEYTRTVLKAIHSRYREGLSLGGVAYELGISASYLSRIFKEDMGIGFNEYLTKVRIDQVIESIQSGGGKMKDVAESCGFSNYNYFFRVFKEQTGMTPAQYFSK
ncbi:MAG: response regulator [Lachnospiraceae bacterium]|nr:response regulator [Lachnospiraceae bacterium]